MATPTESQDQSTSYKPTESSGPQVIGVSKASPDPRLLSGYTVGITADRRSEEQIQLLEDRGATCVHGPVLETRGLLPDSGVSEATRSLIDNPPDFTILNTGIGVRGWFSSADALLLGGELRTAIDSSKIYTRGPKAQGAAITAGLDLLDGTTHTSLDAIMGDLTTIDLRGKRVAVQLDGDPDAKIITRLSDLEAEVVPVPVYQWSLPANTDPAEELIQALVEHRLDAITFTARPAVKNFVAIAERIERLSEVRDVLDSTATAVLCVGQGTAELVAEHSLGNPRFPDRPLLGTMVMLLTEYLDGCTNEVELAGHRIVLRGREPVGSGPPQMLSVRERQLFEVLASKPGVVFPKDRLLSWVWREAAQDEHAVEVAVGRLRKRLGDAGCGIETVRRRGYRMAAA